jgi:hypothetical protein
MTIDLINLAFIVLIAFAVGVVIGHILTDL